MGTPDPLTHARGARFYHTGGTLPRDAPSYVRRLADEALYAALLEGEFCYVLTPRQMGKSSLMVRTVARLRAEGRAAAVLDLTALGKNLTAEQWYDGLLTMLGRQLGLEDELEAYWARPGVARLGPLQRWMGALQEVVLAERAEPLIIFVDEIDLVRSLAFSADEFFGAIRECYNRRAEDPAFGRITFCLLGVASPPELIDNAIMTPFNIGRKIEMADFTLADASPLAQGFGLPERIGQRLLARVLHWTGGHPYLTQRLCQAVADERVTTAHQVDAACARLFFSKGVADTEPNLTFVADRLLHADGGADPAGLLTLYGRVLAGQMVPNDDALPHVPDLKIAGIVRVDAGRLRVRNRIYAHVFGRTWLEANMPGAELRRQRAAFRRGWTRALSLASVVLVIMSVLAGVAVYEWRASERAREAEQVALREADGFEALREWNLGNAGKAAETLDRYLPRWPGGGEPTWLWRYLWGVLHRDVATLRGHSAKVFAVAVSPLPEARWIASAGFDGLIIVRDGRTYRPITTLLAPFGAAYAVAFSSDGRWLAAGGGREMGDGWIRLYDTRNWAPTQTLPGTNAPVWALAFSPDSRLLAVGTAASQRGMAQVYATRAWRLRWSAPDIAGSGRSLAFSPQGDRLYIGMAGTMEANSMEQHSGLVRVRDARTGAPLRDLRVSGRGGITCLAISPDGRTLAASFSQLGLIAWWDLPSGRPPLVRATHRRWLVNDLAFSPDGRTLASAGWDQTVRLWDTATRTERRMLRSHRDLVNAVAFLPGGRLVSASNDRTVRVWDTTAPDQTTIPAPPGYTTDAGFAAALSPDGRLLVLGFRDGRLRVWDLARWRWEAAIAPTGREILTVAFAPRGNTLVTVDSDGKVVLWDTMPLRRRTELPERAQLSETQLAFSPDGKRLVTAPGPPTTVSVWSTVTGHLLLRSAPLDALSTRIALSPDGQTLALALETVDNPVLLVDPAKLDRVDWKRAPPLRPRDPDKGHTTTIVRLAFSPDSRQLASSDVGGNVALWDLLDRSARGEVTCTSIPAHVGIVSCIAYLDDGQTLVTVGNDRLIRLWDRWTHRNVAAFTDQLSENIVAPLLAAMSPGRRFVTMGEKSIHVWGAPTIAEIRRREVDDARLAAKHDVRNGLPG